MSDLMTLTFSELRDAWQSLLVFYLTGAFIALGVSLGNGDVMKSRPYPIDAIMRFDGLHYLDITEHNYRYDPDSRSTVAFFPLYPLLARGTATLTGSEPNVALILTSNAALLGALVVLARYARARPGDHGDSSAWTLTAFCVYPAAFFLRMGYSESCFTLFALLMLLGMARRWPPVLIAVCAGLCTATRPVGVAATAAVIYYLARQDAPRPARLKRIIFLTPVACSGLLAYMAYQAYEFGDPLAFAHTQEHWTSHAPADRSTPAKIAALATLEPITGIYDAESPRYWAGWQDSDSVLFTLAFWNAPLYLLAVGLVAFGAVRGWLTGPEVVFGAATLLIPYLTRAYEMSMASHARFASVAIPAHLVAGRMLAAMPPPLAGAVCALSATVMVLWTALYASGRSFF